MPARGPGSAIREFFLPRRHIELAAAVSEPGRLSAQERLALGRQKQAAAQALWLGGHRAEALPLLQNAMRLLDEAAGALCAELGEHAASAEDGAAPSRLLRLAGQSTRSIELVATARAQALQTRFPALEDELGPAHEQSWAQLDRACKVMVRAIAYVAATRRQIAGQQRRRIAGLLLALLAASGALVWMLRTPPRIHATASAHWGDDPRYVPEGAVDGSRHTEWLLPDGQTGWLELRPVPSRNLKLIRVMNAHNGTTNDRATRQYTIEVYSRGVLVQTIPASYAEFSSTPVWNEHPVAVQNVDRVKLTIQSFFKLGGGLAEVELR